jgi:hypothetical protein
MQTSQSTSEKRYTYSELEGSAKDRARQHYIEHWIIDDWYDSVYYDFKSEGIVHGFHIEDIKFSGFWSQGDGASWIGDIDLVLFIEKHLPESIGRDCWVWMIQDGWIHNRLSVYQKGSHYSHSNTMSIGNIETYDYSNGEDGEEVNLINTACILKGAPVQTLYDLIVADTNCSIKSVDDLEELALTEARQYADEIYSTLQGAYEHECSDDNISESYDANEVLFNEEGEIV